MRSTPGWIAALVMALAGAAGSAIVVPLHPAVAQTRDTGTAPPAAEARRQLPPGFAYLPEIGEANIFEQFSEAGRRGVHSISSQEAGIIRKAIDLPLGAKTEIDFEWRYVALPALGPETEAGFHDYHSIAVEFDNGQDITWFWSRELAPGTKFRCPLAGWKERETHIVLQSGTAGLGEWVSHRRPVLADYLEAVGGDPPGRIVAVWFIANSAFGRRPGEAYFANVRLRDGDRSVEVFATPEP